MRCIQLNALFCWALLLAGCSDASQEPESPSGQKEQISVSFSADLVPVLRGQCAACHMTGSEPGGLKLYPAAAYDSMVGAISVSTGKLLVAPGDPEASYMLHKIQGTHVSVGGSGARMPQGQHPLDEGTLNQFVSWVEQGAAKN